MESVVVRFAGDSGDGIQIVGERFTDTSVMMPNEVSTFPDFPAEIRAPAGSIPGVSAFQVHFGSKSVLTPGDQPDALIAMNPAALAVHVEDLVEGGLLVVNESAFTEANLKLAGYDKNPLDDPDLAKRYDLFKLDISELTKQALTDSPLSARDKLRCKNFFALGFMCWVYSRKIERTIQFIEKKWGEKHADLADANILVLKAGYFFGDTTETHRNRYMVARADVKPGTYRKVTGNEAMALGLLAAARKAERQLLFSGYPITPASSILETLADYKQFGVRAVQAEDEIAAVGVALCGSYAGSIGVTATSGPGMCLKSEFIGLAVSTELPLVICNVQRGGPSTGLPTKTEQSDLLQALFGRHGEGPLPVVAANSPSHCFKAAFEAVRLALKYSTPVIVLSDAYLANGAEPWRVLTADSLPDISVPFATPGETYHPFKRNPETLSRVQAVPGQPGLEHRIGGLEKNEEGNVTYDPYNHTEMTRQRAAKIENIAGDIEPVLVHGKRSGKVIVLGWGGTYGTLTAAGSALRAEGFEVTNAHIFHLNPLPPDLPELLSGFDKVLVAELNSGQLCMLVRARYLIDAIPFSKIAGRPFKVREVRERVLELLND